jgi:regulator of replication initiation timing
MSQPIKVTDQEIADIRSLASKFQEKVFQFGEFRIERMNLLDAVRDVEAREAKAEEEYRLLQKMDGELRDRLTQKYGEGSLNMTQGTFIPAVPVTKQEKTAVP